MKFLAVALVAGLTIAQDEEEAGKCEGGWRTGDGKGVREVDLGNVGDAGRESCIEKANADPRCCGANSVSYGVEFGYHGECFCEWDVPKEGGGHGYRYEHCILAEPNADCTVTGHILEKCGTGARTNCECTDTVAAYEDRPVLQGEKSLADCSEACKNHPGFQHASGLTVSGESGDNNCACCAEASGKESSKANEKGWRAFTHLLKAAVYEPHKELTVCRGMIAPRKPPTLEGGDWVKQVNRRDGEPIEGDGEFYRAPSTGRNSPIESIEQCAALCTTLSKSWGCTHYSFASDDTNWCFVHQDCSNADVHDEYHSYIIAGYVGVVAEGEERKADPQSACKFQDGQAGDLNDKTACNMLEGCSWNKAATATVDEDTVISGVCTLTDDWCKYRNHVDGAKSRRRSRIVNGEAAVGCKDLEVCTWDAELDGGTCIKDSELDRLSKGLSAVQEAKEDL